MGLGGASPVARAASRASGRSAVLRHQRTDARRALGQCGRSSGAAPDRRRGWRPSALRAAPAPACAHRNRPCPPRTDDPSQRIAPALIDSGSPAPLVAQSATRGRGVPSHGNQHSAQRNLDLCKQAKAAVRWSARLCAAFVRTVSQQSGPHQPKGANMRKSIARRLVLAPMVESNPDDAYRRSEGKAKRTRPVRKSRL
jgi:hypothetical protein